MSTADQQLRILFQLSRMFRDVELERKPLHPVMHTQELSPPERVEELHHFLFDLTRHGDGRAEIFKHGDGRAEIVRRGARALLFDLSGVKDWDTDSLQRAVYFVEEIAAAYTHLYHDPRVIPVTYYKREKHIRRHLDRHFSMLFMEIMSRAGRSTEKELITQEPIYYLMQIAREKSFPKDRDGHANLTLLKQRIHLDLSHRLSPEGSEETRRVLLPHEIRRR